MKDGDTVTREVRQLVNKCLNQTQQLCCTRARMATSAHKAVKTNAWFTLATGLHETTPAAHIHVTSRVELCYVLVIMYSW